MKIMKSLIIWICFIPAAILNGGLREYVLVPVIGQKWALPASGIILSGLIFLICLSHFSSFLPTKRVGRAPPVERMLTPPPKWLHSAEAAAHQNIKQKTAVLGPVTVQLGGLSGLPPWELPWEPPWFALAGPERLQALFEACLNKLV